MPIRKTTIRSRAPLLLGFAGGGTDAAPYCDQCGGYVLNANIDQFDNFTLEHDPKGHLIELHALELCASETLPVQSSLPIEGELRLHRVIFNRIVPDYLDCTPLAVKASTWSDAPQINFT